MLLLVCDGMGSAPGGAVAAHLAASAVTLGLRERWRGRKATDPRTGLGECLREAVEAANRLVHARARARSALEGMGTTITAAGLVGSYVHLAQVGDSRAYLLRRGRARLLTRDQTVAQEMLDLGLLSQEEAARSPYRNVLAQSLGTEAGIDPVVGRCELEPGDTVLLCTDGLSGVVGSSELAHFVGEAPTPSAACRRLVALANERGAPDNVTVVIGRMAERGSAPDEEASP
jgi:PPM family protein phosphatase